MRVTILGGGGFRVPLIARQLAASGLPVSAVTLYDTDPARLAVIADVLRGDPVALCAGPARTGRAGTAALPLATVTELDAALRGADVIFSALRPGGLNGRVSDERTALTRGVLGQETVGAGGLSSAFRTVPVVSALAHRIAALAPAAWVISMTNPAGIVTEVMAAVLGPRVIGVCDSPVGLIRRACAAAGVDPGPSLGAVTDRVDADYLGINHLGWLRALRVSGTDLLPGLLAFPWAACGDRGGAAVRRGPAVRARRDTERVPVLVLRARRGAARRPGRRADPRRARAGAAAGVLRRRGGRGGGGGPRVQSR